MKFAIRIFLLALFALTATATVVAHETQLVGDEEDQYKIIVGYSTEPAYTEERNGLDLFIRTADNEPVENLERSLTATLIAPDGVTTRQLDLRASYGQPGDYTDDFVLTMTGVYQLHLTGFIGGTEIDLIFDMHELGQFNDLRFP